MNDTAGPMRIAIGIATLGRSEILVELSASLSVRPACPTGFSCRT